MVCSSNVLLNNCKQNIKSLSLLIGTTVEGLLILVYVTGICVIIYTTDNFLHIFKLYILAKCDSCRLPITFANSLDPGHVGPDFTVVIPLRQFGSRLLFRC